MQLMCVYGSSRENGNSELLADQVIQGLPVTRVYLRDWQVPQIVDRRHAPGGFPPLEAAYEPLYTALLTHTPLIFATPLYWYGMSGLMKSFVDRWSHVMRDKRYNFREAMAGKDAYVVITGGDNPRQKGLPLVQQFQWICDFLGMRFAGYLIGEGNQPGEVLEDRRALADAALIRQSLRDQLRLGGSESRGEGNPIPPLLLASTAGRTVNLAEEALRSHLVLFVYPGDGAGLRYPELRGCTAEACAVRDHVEVLRGLGAAVFGVSLQGTERQHRFVAREHLPFELLSDAASELVKALGIPVWRSDEGEEFAARTTVIVSRGGRIARLFRSVQVEGHVAEVIQALEELAPPT